ncbi:MAG: Asp-tRNA(Asn)/Glu-tRNA(Gln) amidotransferase GatCAB subunit C [Candidatus Niyogibacteria bacterium CG10_big_fil_rev_8_21_14_0_10_46_36]|uniref:Aspartyl/glutamyl-tRNA(Asn/Gln) amidotransferase subunit C n=1 Tax=Candidatus Niyogibacteria bacterium CG10_big_fil_rev_8_21_14_0_10_46_36 TaxID=1974726 RepID=A0A2H0TDQ3_9BACT|nr:MAG: Asp-tRNA(Asn)/Glu-tRNA(Gln) amidotransferase GatCAB subunit C [Candidatus Niyogibacteria bacterium CG10_big_fil_rev_8_21_14_0_10_46_36]
MISAEEIEHLARLARIHINERDKNNLAHDLQAILEYVKTLQEADVGDETFTHFEHLTSSLRGDTKENTEDTELIKRLLAAAPMEEDGYIKVKNVLEK